MFGGEESPFVHEPEGKKSNPLWGVAQAIIVALVVNLVLYFLIILPSQVDGHSMTNTLHDKELLFANKIPTWLGDTDIGQQLGFTYKRGDIVIIDDPQHGYIVKRIIALPYDKIMILDNKVTVNGQVIKEPYLKPDGKTELPSISRSTLEEGVTQDIPVDTYFVMGDNREGSLDSRFTEIGFVKKTNIKGVVFVRIWPIENFTFFGSPY